MTRVIEFLEWLEPLDTGESGGASFDLPGGGDVQVYQNPSGKPHERWVAHVGYAYEDTLCGYGSTIEGALADGVNEIEKWASELARQSSRHEKQIADIKALLAEGVELVIKKEEVPA